MADSASIGRCADTVDILILLPGHPIIAIGINELFYCDNSAIITIKETTSIMGCFGGKINMVYSFF